MTRPATPGCAAWCRSRSRRVALRPRAQEIAAGLLDELAAGGGDVTDLLARFPGLSLAIPPHELRWRPVSLMNGLESLPVHLSGTGHRS